MSRAPILFVAMALSVALFIKPCRAQGQHHAERKVVSRIAPLYPDIARRNHLKGVVTLEVVVRKDGSVQSAEVVGGNPILIQSAANAVSKWKFERAPEETTELVQLVFGN